MLTGRLSFAYGVNDVFDPTAFENVKVVLEGAIYDLDLSGVINIVDRDDLINTAKLSRKSAIWFQLTQSAKTQVTAKLSLEAELENLAAELLNGSLSKKLSGCFIYLEFLFEQQQRIIDYEHIKKILVDIWGTNRKITHEVTFYPLQEDKKLVNVVKVEFNRLIHEDQMDDLVVMIDSIVTTLDCLQAYLSVK